MNFTPHYLFRFKFTTCLLVGITFVIASIPLLNFGFSGDDVLNSQTRGLILISHKTLTQFTTDIIKNWLYAGRFYPIPFITQYSIFYMIGDNVIVYNAIHWLAIIISLLITGLLLKKITNSLHIVLLFFSLFPISWNLTLNSPLVSQVLLLPLLTSFIMLTLIHYINYIRFRKKRSLIFFSLTYILALLTYEIALILPALILVLKKRETGYFIKKNSVGAITIGLITLGYFFTIIVIRHFYGTGYEGTTLGDFNKIPVTFLKQFLGELPLINYLFEAPIVQLNYSYYVLFIIILLCSSILLYQLLAYHLQIKKVKYLFLFSALLQILPALLIAVSKKYQVMSFGKSHIPVYLQQIGLGIMLSLSLNYFSIYTSKYSWKNYSKLALAITLGSLISVSFLINQNTNIYFNQATRYPREIYEKALKMGLLDSLPINSILIKKFSGSEFLWNSTYLRAQLINRSDILLFDFNGKAPLVDHKYEQIFTNLPNNALNKSFFYLDYEHLPDSPQSGYVFLAKIEEPAQALLKPKLSLSNTKLFYIAKSKGDLLQIINKIQTKYKISNNFNVNELHRPTKILTLNTTVSINK